MKRKVVLAVLAIFSICLFSVTDTFALIIIGEGLENPANPSTWAPFNVFNGSTAPKTQYQQVYSADEFTGIMNIIIDEIQYYNTGRDPSTGFPLLSAVATAQYDIYLSTTSVTPLTLDFDDYSNNIGPSPELFFSGILGGPAPGTVYSIFGDAYTYNPAQGNLLVDITVSNRTLPGYGGFDWAFLNFGSASNWAQNFSDRPDIYKDATQRLGLTTGLVTGFEGVTQPIPEPSTMLLFGSGLLGLWGFRRKKRF